MEEQEQQLFNKVFHFFKGNVDKTLNWFYLDNPLLGGISPKNMIDNGGIDKLEEFVNTQLGENKL